MTKPDVKIDSEVFQFLMGRGPLEATWFGDKHPTRPGEFWWRSVIRDRMIARAKREVQS